MDRLQRYLHRVRKLFDITFFRVFYFIILAFLLYAAMFTNVKPEKLNLSLFTVAKKTIRSPITVEDKASTEEKKNEAMDQVNDVYFQKKEYTKNRVDLITSIFDSALEVQDETRANEQKAGEAADPKSPDTTAAGPKSPDTTVADMAARLKEKLTDRVAKDLTDQDFTALVQANRDDLSHAKDLTVTTINNVMSMRISSSNLENAKKRVEQELKYSTLPRSLKNASIDLGKYAVIQNEFYDPNATEELRQQAAENVEPVKILQGQIIVEEGQLINPEIFRQLKLVGLINNSNNFKPFLGLGFLVTLFLTALYYHFHQMKESAEKKQTYLLLYGIVFALSIFIMKLMSMLQTFDYTWGGYLLPAALTGMLIKILIDEKLAILTSIIMAVCGSILFNGGLAETFNFSEGVYILFSALAATLFLGSQNHRSKILQAGLFSSLVNSLTVCALLFIPNGQFSGLGPIFNLAAALGSGIASGVLTIGLLPFFEASFGILSTLKLIELSNPNHPLLRKILTETPGTYHHSLMVANLAESACEAIQANGLLARVGSYYHDIGKTKRPIFFIENQMNQANPHDRLAPEKSASIIISHVTDGVNILKSHRMPKEIIDIAEQHHGTTLLKYFYNKAKQSDTDVNEEEYRYPGPKAQTKESAIVGIADSVEAAVRSMAHPTPDQIERLVKNIIADRLQDGQLNECELTLKELETVSFTLCETLKGIFHSRIEYPELTIQKVRQA